MSGYSIWCDFIENSFLDNEFLQMLASGTINGATSNPSIFKNAITTSAYYKERIKQLNIKNKEELFLALALEDIKKAALKMSCLYAKDSNNGFISFEINPLNSNNAGLSIAEGLKIANLINMPNLMIKVPATNAGYEVMNTLASYGISINATLIFSHEQAKKCNDAISEGMKKYKAKNPNGITNKGVVSIFVSRVDSLLNHRYSVKNQIGIQNAIYSASKVDSENIRALFASTGTKSNDLSKDYYLKELELNNTINTAPINAINAYRPSKNIKNLNQELITSSKEFIFSTINEIEYDNACKKLLDDGLVQFEKAYIDILENL